MGRSVYRAERRKGMRKEGDDLSDYIMPGLKTIEVSRLYLGGGGQIGDHQIFTRHKAVRQAPHRSSLLRRIVVLRRAKYTVMTIEKHESEKCTSTIRDLKKECRDRFAHDFRTLRA